MLRTQTTTTTTQYAASDSDSDDDDSFDYLAHLDDVHRPIAHMRIKCAIWTIWYVGTVVSYVGFHRAPNDTHVQNIACAFMIAAILSYALLSMYIKMVYREIIVLGAHALLALAAIWLVTMGMRTDDLQACRVGSGALMATAILPLLILLVSEHNRAQRRL